jgi:hypothetical protein
MVGDYEGRQTRGERVIEGRGTWGIIKHQKTALISYVGVGNCFILSTLGLSHLSASLHGGL